jgi:hypothetical protein
MNERLITAAGALLALMLIVGLFLQPGAEPPVTRPTSAELGPNGYRVLEAWLTVEGVPVQSVRERLGFLSEDHTAGNVFLTTLPHEKPLHENEIVELLSWIARGNTLLILAALNDTPDWSLLPDSSAVIEDLQQLAGATFEAAIDEQGDMLLLGELFQQTEVELQAVRYDHPLTRDIGALRAHSDSTASIWMPATDSVSPGSPFIREKTSGLDAGWVDSHGDGHIVTFAVGSIFTNRALTAADNRVLLSNLIHWHMKPGGRALFDDFHQGLSNLYDPEAFYSDSRVGRTILFILLFWFVYVVGTQNRLGSLRSSSSAPRQGEFVAALGGFLARKVSRIDTARLMYERWFEELRERGILRQDASPWACLADSPLVDDKDLGRLRAMHQQLQTGGKVDLRQLHNQIQSIREALG